MHHMGLKMRIAQETRARRNRRILLGGGRSTRDRDFGPRVFRTMTDAFRRIAK